MENLFKNYIYPISTLSGSIIGVGFLSLPYITLQVGIWPMIIYFVILTGLVLIIHLIFGQIALKTPDFRRWPGFLEFYFGKYSKLLFMPLIVFGGFGVMLVYLIISGEFLTATFGPVIGGNVWMYVALYWLLASTFIFFGVKAISKIDFMMIALLLIALLFILIKGFDHANLSNIFISNIQTNASSYFLPFGAIMFSLWGTGLIPEVEEMIRGHKGRLKKIITIATLIPASIYLLFILLVLSITGSQTTESALVGIRETLGDGIISIALLIGVITTFISFIAQGLLLKKIFIYDAHIKELPAFILVSMVPLILFLLGLNSFIPLISFIGGVLLSIEGILILLIYKKLGGKKIIVYPLMLVFMLAIIYSIQYFVA